MKKEISIKVNFEGIDEAIEKLEELLTLLDKLEAHDFGIDKFVNDLEKAVRVARDKA